jgi:hypothetical protein
MLNKNLGRSYKGHMRNCFINFQLKVTWNTGGKIRFASSPPSIICYGRETQLYVNVAMTVTCATVGGSFINSVTKCVTSLVGSIN